MALNLNYQPVPLVDTSTLTEEEWLDWRRKGIGGSDVAAVLGFSPYRTARDLYYDKIGVEPMLEEDDKSITFQIGHLLEDVVAQIFEKKTGFHVYRDQTMYQHPLYPFLIADVDRFLTLPNGETAILECKTAHYDLQYQWANGSVPRHYEAQVRHYLSVMNLNIAYIACLFSNNENDFVWARIERELDDEESTIMQLEQFWKSNVRAHVEPPFVEKPDLVLDTLRRYYGLADRSLPTVNLDNKYAADLEKIIQLRTLKSKADAESRQLDGQIKTLYAPIIEDMGAACGGECTDPNGVIYKITFEPQYRMGIDKLGLSKLKALYPDLYDHFVRRTESRIFRVKKQ